MTAQSVARLPGTVVFDLDGTLIDTIADIAAAMNRAFADEGLSALPVATYRSFVGEGAETTLTRGYQQQTGRAVDPALLEKLHDSFVAHYSARPAEQSEPYPGLLKVLAQLADRDVRMAVCTNKDQVSTDAILATLDMARHFGAIIGVTPALPRKPDPAMLKAAIAGAGGRMDDAVMIGDSKTDVALARNGAIPVIAVSFGYTQTPARELGADLVIDHYDEALAALGKLCPRVDG